MDNTEQRQSNFELLRIFLMLMIVAHHYALFSSLEYSFNTVISKMNAFIGFLFSLSGKVGVNTFVLMTGYFLFDKAFSLKKMLKFLLQIWIYSVGIFLIVGVCELKDITSKEVFRSLVPLGQNNWFAFDYLVLLILSPFFNIAIRNFNRKQLITIIGISIFYCCIGPSINIFLPFLGNPECPPICILSSLYFIGSYCKFYGYGYLVIKKKYIAYSYMLIIIAVFLSNFIISSGNEDVWWLVGISDFSIFVWTISLNLFLFTLQNPIKYNKWINLIASSTFGIYLIHDNDLVRMFLWSNIFHGAQFGDSPFFIVYSLYAILTVFVVCMFVELFRIYALEKPFFRHYGERIDCIQNVLEEKFVRLTEKL